MVRFVKSIMLNGTRKATISVAALVVVLAFSGCKQVDYRPLAVGRDSEIVVVIDSMHWSGPLGETVRNTLGEYLETLPAPEPVFDLRRMDIASRYEDIKKQKNVVFIAPYTDSTATGRFMRSRLPEDAGASAVAQRGIAIHRENLWRRAQMVVYVTAASVDALQETLHEEADDILFLFNRITRERVTRDIFEKGRQRDVEDYLMDRHGFAVNVQHDFQIAIDTTNFVWLRRILSDTWRSIFVYYEENADPSVLSPEWIYATRDSLTEQWVQGNVGGFVEIDRPPRRPLETMPLNFLDRYGFETRGLWQMVGRLPDGRKAQHGMGGPFLSYAFYDQPSGRIYLIDGMVFAPGYEKREFLRHMEAILHTFRSRWETEETVASVADDSDLLAVRPLTSNPPAVSVRGR